MQKLKIYQSLNQALTSDWAARIELVQPDVIAIKSCDQVRPTNGALLFCTRLFVQNVVFVDQEQQLQLDHRPYLVTVFNLDKNTALQLLKIFFFEIARTATRKLFS